MIKVTIDRSRWIAGEYASLNKNNEQCHCAVGFIADAVLGKSIQIFKDLVFTIEEQNPEFTRTFIANCVESIMAINDDKAFTVKQTEDKITEIGKMINIEFDFVNDVSIDFAQRKA
jgi:hypothetical protein